MAWPCSVMYGASFGMTWRLVVTWWLGIRTVWRFVDSHVWSLAWYDLKTRSDDWSLYTLDSLAWQPWDSWTSCTVAQDSNQAQVFSTRQKLHCFLWPHLESQCHFPHTLMLEVVISLPRFKKRGVRRHFLMGKWKGSIVEKYVKWEILLSPLKNTICQIWW